MIAPIMTPAQSSGYAQGYQVGFLAGTKAREQGVTSLPSVGLTPEQAGFDIPKFNDENAQPDLVAQKQFAESFPVGWLDGFNEAYGNDQWQTVGDTQVMPNGEGASTQGKSTKSSSATPWILGGLAVAAAVGIGYALTRDKD